MRKPLCLVVLACFVLGLAAQQQQQPPVPVVPLNFRQQIANTPNANKADTLAWGILTVQNELVDLRQRATQADALERQYTDQQVATLRQSVLNAVLTPLQQRVGALENADKTFAQHIHDLEQQKLSDQIAALQKQISDFRSAACPALKAAKLKDADKANIEKLCQSDSDTSK